MKHLLWILPAAVILTSTADTPDFTRQRDAWHEHCDAIRREKTSASVRCEFQLYQLNAVAKRRGWAPVAEPLPLHPLPFARP
jgi:hypothetical protein